MVLKGLPMANGRISQEYGRKNPMYRKGYHTGIDFVAGSDKSIYNIASGKVLQARFASGKGADPRGWGNYVIVRQTDGYDVLYAHLSRVDVKDGQVVSKGHVLGVQGNTGNSTGAHLHLEVWRGAWTNRNDINGSDYLNIENKVGNIQLLKQEVATVPNTNTPSVWAKDAWEWAKKEGLLDGTRPKDNITREEFAIVLQRLIGRNG